MRFGLCFILLILSTPLFALTLEYPELHVEPSATARIREGAKEELKASYRHFTPLYFSGATTLLAGINQYSAVDLTKDEDKKSADLATAVGALVIGATAYLHSSYRPYLKGFAKIKNKSAKTKRLRLRKERMAEEIMRSAHRMYQKVKWITFIAQFGSGLYMQDKATDDKKLGAQIAIGVSFIPLLFNHFWSETYYNHQENKKKIYAPLVGTSVHQVGRKQHMALNLHWSF